MAKAWGSALIVLVAIGVVISYGLFAVLYWPVTVLADTLAEGYRLLSPENTVATLVVTALWVGATVAGGVLAALTMRDPRIEARIPWAIGFVTVGASVVLLGAPAAFASVGMDNVIPYSTPYSDRLTPVLMAAGAALAAAGIVLAVGRFHNVVIHVARPAHRRTAGRRHTNPR